MGQRKVLAWETGFGFECGAGHREQGVYLRQSARSCRRLGTRQKRGYKSSMKEFKPCSWERVLEYAKETNEPSMFGVEVPENSRYINTLSYGQEMEV